MQATATKVTFGKVFNSLYVYITYVNSQFQPIRLFLELTAAITRPNFSQPSSRIRVDLLSYESKTTDNREQYDWRTEENLDG